MTAVFFYAVLTLIAWWADKPNALVNRNPRRAEAG
jgi:hypothetical protein